MAGSINICDQAFNPNFRSHPNRLILEREDGSRYVWEFVHFRIDQNRDVTEMRDQGQRRYFVPGRTSLTVEAEDVLFRPDISMIPTGDDSVWTSMGVSTTIVPEKRPGLIQKTFDFEEEGESDG